MVINHAAKHKRHHILPGRPFDQAVGEIALDLRNVDTPYPELVYVEGCRRGVDEVDEVDVVLDCHFDFFVFRRWKGFMEGMTERMNPVLTSQRV